MARVSTTLTPRKSGGFTARKRIPEDVQADYERLYGVKWEARLSIDQGHRRCLRVQSTASGSQTSKVASRTSGLSRKARGGP